MASNDYDARVMLKVKEDYEKWDGFYVVFIVSGSNGQAQRRIVSDVQQKEEMHRMLFGTPTSKLEVHERLHAGICLAEVAVLHPSSLEHLASRLDKVRHIQGPSAEMDTDERHKTNHRKRALGFGRRRPSRSGKLVEVKNE